MCHTGRNLRSASNSLWQVCRELGSNFKNYERFLRIPELYIHICTPDCYTRGGDKCHSNCSYCRNSSFQCSYVVTLYKIYASVFKYHRSNSHNHFFKLFFYGCMWKSHIHGAVGNDLVCWISNHGLRSCSLAQKFNNKNSRELNIITMQHPSKSVFANSAPSSVGSLRCVFSHTFHFL